MSENIRVNYISATETENGNRNGRNESIFVGNQATIIWLFQENEKNDAISMYTIMVVNNTVYFILWVYIQWYFFIM